MGKPISGTGAIDAYAGPVTDTTKLPFADAETLEAGTALQLKTYMNIPSAVTVDADPTNGSSNAVSSNGVFDALALKLDASAAFNPAVPGAIGGTTPNTIAGTSQTLTGGTRTTSGSTLSITETLNNAAVAFPGALVINQTHTASAAGSLGLDVQAGGVSKFSVRKDSAFGVQGDSTFKPGTFNGQNGMGWYRTTESSPRSAIATNGMVVGSDGYFVFTSSAANAAGTFETALARSGAGILKIVDYSGNTLRDLTLRNLVSSGGVITPSAYTTATRPAWVNGNVIFDSDLDKLVIGGASAWEAVTSV